MGLAGIDKSLFLLLNRDLRWSGVDGLMAFASDPGAVGFTLVALAFVALLVWGKGLGRKTVLLVGLSLALTDPISARLAKPMVGRKRPNNPDYAIREGSFPQGHNGSPSYPSSHAANISGVATLLCLAYPGSRVLWLGIAGLVGYSRVYLGQHFPLDIAGGALLGFFVALLLWELSNLVLFRWRSGKGEAEGPGANC